MFPGPAVFDDSRTAPVQKDAMEVQPTLLAAKCVSSRNARVRVLTSLRLLAATGFSLALGRAILILSVLACAIVPAAAHQAQSIEYDLAPNGAQESPVLNVQTHAAQVRSMKLISPGTGWVLTKEKLLWTNSGGKEWSDITPPGPASQTLDAVFFLDVNRGWALRSVPDPSLNSRRMLEWASTSDSGKSWSIEPFNVSDDVISLYSGGASIEFPDQLHGWVMLRHLTSSNFDTGTLFATMDGGSNWEELPDPPAGDTVRFTTATDGWLAGGPGGDKLYVTRDAGKSWNTVAVTPRPGEYAAYRVLYDLPAFENAQDGLLPVTFAGPETSVLVVYRTHDAGQTWKTAEVHTDGVRSGSRIASSVLDSTVVRTFLNTGGVGVAEGGRPTQIASQPPGLWDGAVIVRSDFANETDGWLMTSAGKCRASKSGCNQQTLLLGTTDGGRTFNNLDPQVEPASEPSTPLSEEESVSAQQSGAIPLTSTQIGKAEGFDKCTADTAGNMQTWWNSSPYRYANIYIGGASRACSQPYLNSTWVSQIRGMGWGLIPTWVGPQAPCTSFSSTFSTDPSTAAAQGTSEADAASSAASSLGIAGTIIYYDLEHYNTTPSCSAAVSAFMNAWVAELHSNGYLAAAYGSPYNMEVDWINIANVPDAVWIGEWDGVDSTTGLADISDTLWPNDQRIHQYKGSTYETYGGVQFDLDKDVLDAPVVPGIASGTGPSVTVSPLNLSFANQGVGTTSAPQAVTLTNTGAATLVITNIATSANFGQSNNCAGNVAAGGSCTINVTFSPTATGTLSGNLTLTDNSNGVLGSTQSVSLSGTGQDFSFAPPSGSSTSATVTHGQTATYTLSVGGQGGMSGTVSFVCAGAPSEANCIVSPNPVTAGSSATNVTVTVTTTAPTVSAPRSRPLPPVPPLSPGLRGLLMFTLVLVAMTWAIVHRNQPSVIRLKYTMLALASGLLLTLALAGCGGGGGSGTTHDPGTPTGTYTLTVTGTMGSGSSALSHSVTLTLIVSQ